MLSTASKTETLQILVFPFQTLQIAVHLADVQKVIPMPEIVKSGEKWMGVTQVDDRGLIIVDLHHKIYGCANLEPETHLIILKASENRLFGVPVTTVPTLMSVPATLFQPLPSDYRDRDTLGIASHMASMQQGDVLQTIFLMDRDRLFAEV